LNKYPHEDWRIGDWRVSPDRGEISREGDTKRLDPRAMRLLMFLAERAGEIVGVTELLDGVWGKAVVTPHSVYEAVAALRQALGDSPDKPDYIVTLPRRGCPSARPRDTSFGRTSRPSTRL
jgi:DNA-binding winged helix-turn-helix (wHTH) protein